MGLHLLEEAVHKSNSPESVFQTVPYSAREEFIPDEHRAMRGLPILPVTKVLLQAVHNMVRVAEEEVLCEIHRAEELLVSGMPSQQKKKKRHL